MRLLATLSKNHWAPTEGRFFSAFRAEPVQKFTLFSFDINIVLFRLINWMVWLISDKSETTVVRAQYVGDTYVWSTKVMSRFFNSFPVDLAVNACNSPTSRHTPITSKINQRRKWNSISKLTNAWRKSVINRCVIIRIFFFHYFQQISHWSLQSYS